jgi:hypothetical protein
LDLRPNISTQRRKDAETQRKMRRREHQGPEKNKREKKKVSTQAFALSASLASLRLCVEEFIAVVNPSNFVD